MDVSINPSTSKIKRTVTVTEKTIVLSQRFMVYVEEGLPTSTKRSNQHQKSAIGLMEIRCKTPHPVRILGQKGLKQNSTTSQDANWSSSTSRRKKRCYNNNFGQENVHLERITWYNEKPSSSSDRTMTTMFGVISNSHEGVVCLGQSTIY